MTVNEKDSSSWEKAPEGEMEAQTLNPFNVFGFLLTVVICLERISLLPYPGQSLQPSELCHALVQSHYGINRFHELSGAHSSLVTQLLRERVF